MDNKKTKWYKFETTEEGRKDLLEWIVLCPKNPPAIMLSTLKKIEDYMERGIKTTVSMPDPFNTTWKKNEKHKPGNNNNTLLTELSKLKKEFEKEGSI